MHCMINGLGRRQRIALTPATAGVEHNKNIAGAIMPRCTPDLVRLRRTLARLEAPRHGRPIAALGDPTLDAALPWGGLPRNGLHDIIRADGDAAADGFALALAARIVGTGGRILHVGLWHRAHGDGRPYGPGLVRCGIDPDRLLLVVVRRPAELLWLMEEGLRSGALAVVIGDGVAADLTASRRLQLAAEAGGTTALLLPPAGARSSAALTRWRIVSASSIDGPFRPRWRVTLERCRGGLPGDWLVEWDDATHRFCVVPALANRHLVVAATHG